MLVSVPTRRVVIVSTATVAAAAAVGALVTLGAHDTVAATDEALLAAAINDEQALLAAANGLDAAQTARALAAQISAFGATPTQRRDHGTDLGAGLTAAAQDRARDCVAAQSAVLAATFASAAAGLDQIQLLYRTEQAS
jgi:hypothetical protein